MRCNMIHSKIISSLEKFFPADKLSDYAEFTKLSALKGERVSFQFAAHTDFAPDHPSSCEFYTPEVIGAPARSVRIRSGECIPARFTVRPNGIDENYLKNGNEKG